MEILPPILCVLDARRLEKAAGPVLNVEGCLANHNSNNEAGADYGQQMVTDNSTHQVAGQVSSISLWEMTNQQPIGDEIRLRKWCCVGHILRRPQTSIAQQALTWMPQGRRRERITQEHLAAGLQTKLNMAFKIDNATSGQSGGDLSWAIPLAEPNNNNNLYSNNTNVHILKINTKFCKSTWYFLI